MLSLVPPALYNQDLQNPQLSYFIIVVSKIYTAYFI